MESYELWKTLMYGVGVFVTCNVGGQVLMRLLGAGKPIRKGVPVSVVRMSDGEMADFAEHLKRFAENRRQVDAGRMDADSRQWERETDADAASGDSDAESV